MESDDLFSIDPRRLDHECLHQARLSRAAGGREADARHAHAQAKGAYDVVRARTALRVRAAPGAFQLRDKPTVDEIEACVTVQPDCIAALTALNLALFALDIAKADTNAFLDRRKMIERLVDLTALDYAAEREPRPHTAGGRAAFAASRLKAEVGDGIEMNSTRNED